MPPGGATSDTPRSHSPGFDRNCTPERTRRSMVSSISARSAPRSPDSGRAERRRGGWSQALAKPVPMSSSRSPRSTSSWPREGRSESLRARTMSPFQWFPPRAGFLDFSSSLRSVRDPSRTVGSSPRVTTIRLLGEIRRSRPRPNGCASNSPGKDGRRPARRGSQSSIRPQCCYVAGRPSSSGCADVLKNPDAPVHGGFDRELSRAASSLIEAVLSGFDDPEMEAEFKRVNAKQPPSQQEADDFLRRWSNGSGAGAERGAARARVVSAAPTLVSDAASPGAAVVLTGPGGVGRESAHLACVARSLCTSFAIGTLTSEVRVLAVASVMAERRAAPVALRRQLDRRRRVRP